MVFRLKRYALFMMRMYCILVMCKQVDVFFGCSTEQKQYSQEPGKNNMCNTFYQQALIKLQI